LHVARISVAGQGDVDKLLARLLHLRLGAVSANGWYNSPPVDELGIQPKDFI
jgi:hypothetical protein